MPGIVDYIKEVFRSDFWKDILYASAGGLAGAFTGALVQKITNTDDTTTTGKIVQLGGSLLGGAIAAVAIENFAKDRAGAYWAMFGSVFPPIYEIITDKINPAQYAEKVASSMGLTWAGGAKAAMTIPVTVTAPVVEAKTSKPSTRVVYY